MASPCCAISPPAAGRAVGGEELGGLQALNFHHRRAAVQASTDVLATL